MDTRGHSRIGGMCLAVVLMANNVSNTHTHTHAFFSYLTFVHSHRVISVTCSLMEPLPTYIQCIAITVFLPLAVMCTPPASLRCLSCSTSPPLALLLSETVSEPIVKPKSQRQSELNRMLTGVPTLCSISWTCVSGLLC